MKRILIKLGLGSAGAFVALNALTIPGMLTHPIRTVRKMRRGRMSNDLFTHISGNTLNRSSLVDLTSAKTSQLTALGLKPHYGIPAATAN